MDPELFHRMQEAARRFRTGESDYEEIMTPNGLARILRDASDPRGFRIEFVGDGARRSVAVQEYPAAATRPPGYPAPLPFLEACAATVDTVGQSVTWHDPEDLEHAVERVAAQCREDGWAEVDGGGAAAGEEGARLFEKDGVRRTLGVGSAGGRPLLVLRERREG